MQPSANVGKLGKHAFGCRRQVVHQGNVARCLRRLGSGSRILVNLLGIPIEGAVRLGGRHTRLRLDQHKRLFHRFELMVEQLARAGEARATSMEEERHVAAKLVRSLLDQRVVLGDAPQASCADKRRRRVGRAAAQTALVRDVLLDANVNRVVVRDIGLTCEQVNRLEHDVIAYGDVEGRHSPARIAADRNKDIARRASARRVRWRAFFGGFERRARGNDVRTLHVQNIVKRHGMKDRRHVVVSIITAIADA